MTLRAAIAAALTSALVALPVSEAAARQQSTDVVAPAAVLLDVPYLTQTESLCGGAALAMVLRYWGERDVVAEDFAPRLEPDGSGIRTSSLVAAVHDRGWLVSRAGPEATIGDVEAAIGQRRPAIVLIEDRPGVRHYVVVVALTADVVVVHDPARRPFLSIPRDRFREQWRRADNWLLLVLPPAGPRVATPAGHSGEATAPIASAPASPCDALVAESIRIASTDPNAAEAGLLTATRLCPSSASAWTELAGLRVLQARWSDASVAARRATSLAPADDHAWRVLATSSYLEGDRAAALAAWNHIGEPRVDAVAVHGARRTPHPVIVDRLGLRTRSLLSDSAFRRAQRRLDDLPIALITNLKYTSFDGGLASIDARVLERPAVPDSWIAWSAIGLRSAITRELGVDFGGLARSGDLLSTAWRWREASPRIAFDFAVPGSVRLPGVFHLEASWERQTYRPDASSSALIREERRRGGLAIEDWITDTWRVRAGGAVDRFDSESFVTSDVAIERRSPDDRLSLSSQAAGWLGRDDRHFWSAAIDAAWRSSTDQDRPVWSARAGATYASRDAPLALWSGAGAGRGRDQLLRAHDLDDDGIVDADVFGRRLLWTTIEHERPLWQLGVGTIAVAGFADVAQAAHRLLTATASQVHVDFGAGLRVRPSMFPAAVRLDLGYGLRDGRVQLSAGVVAPWPGR